VNPGSVAVSSFAVVAVDVAPVVTEVLVGFVKWEWQF